MPIALTRSVPSSITQCELTHLARAPIDLARARAQHAAYEHALAETGCTIERLPPEDAMPDSVFVEDTALVFDELVVITRPGAESRRGETASVAAALARYRPLATIEAPAVIDGGDMLRVGRDVYVGLSTRTNDAAIEQLTRLLSPHRYRVHAVTVHGCLHLKSAATEAGDGMVLVNPEWIDASRFAKTIAVDPEEPAGANVLRIGGTLLAAAAFPRTNARLREAGFHLRVIEADELAKAEAALTCCSLIIR
jgi:dimethylargininase